MNPTPANSQPPRTESLQEISRWSRAYGQNRSLGVAVFMIVFLMLSAAIGGPSYLAAQAYRSGNWPLLCGCVAVLVVAVGALIYLSVPRWGGRLQARIVARLYAKEGNVAFSAPSERRRFWGLLLGTCFGICIFGSVVIDFVFDLPLRYMQPISALYVVPFLVGLWFLMRPQVGWPALLWPILYAAHGVLIVAGAPVLFTSPWAGLNMLIPIAGYGLLSGLVGHLYGRYALRRLKSLTRDATADFGRSESLEEDEKY